MPRRWLNAVLDAPPVERSRLTKRELLRFGLASAGSLLLSESESRAIAQSGRGRKIVVVGAGFAGLACAYELRSAGCEVTVLEARDRIGGRVRSVGDLLPGAFVEAGGEFLGANHPSVQAYAASFGLDLTEVVDDEAERPAPLKLDGRLVTKSEQERLSREADVAYDALTEAARDVVVERPWETKNAAALDRTTTEDWLLRQPISDLARRLVATQLTLDNAVAVSRQSLLGNLAQICGGGLERYWTDTELYRCNGGNERFASALAERIGAERIKLKTPVARIETSDKMATVFDLTGTRYEADEVVLTAPPSTWKSLRFEPAIPIELRPQMGAAVKFLSRVRTGFWERQGFPPSALSDDGTGSLWLGARQIDPSAGAALVGFIGGPAAAEWANAPAEERLRDYVRKVDELQPGFDEAEEETRFMDWVSDPWSRAGYSFPAPGQVTAQGPLLHGGLGRLRFAGEYACYQFVGYMEGALHSGVSVAKAIVRS
jgi:monoamine oxidase